MPSRIGLRHYLKLVLPDTNDFIATIGIIIFVVLLKHYIFQLKFSDFSLLGLYIYLSDSYSLIFLAITFLSYWGWRWGYINPHHMMEVQKKNFQKTQEDPDGVHNNINFFGLIMSIILFVI